jgi:ABC-2 type transport system permease protein
MLNMYVHEIKQYGRITIIWIVSLIATAGLYMALYPSLEPQLNAMKKILENYPPALLDALGVGPNAFLSFAGFYSIIMAYMMLAMSIQAMNLGTGLVAKEEHGHTAEFLLAKPVTRIQVLSAKLLAALTLILITNAAFLTGMLALMMAFSITSISAKVFVLMTLTLFIVQLFFLGLGFLISVTAPKIRSVLSISLSTVFVFYVIGVFDSIIGSAAARYLTPFKFFDNQYIIQNGSYEFGFIGLEVVFLAAVVLAAYYFYLKRDIRTT